MNFSQIIANFKIMRNYYLKYTLLLIFSMMSVLSTYAQLNTKIDLRLTDRPLKEFFSAVESKTDYTFMYNNIDVLQKVSVNAKGMALNAVLDQVLPKLSLTWEAVGKQIIVKHNTKQQKQLSEQPAFSITGVVVDNQGKPLVGATVVQKSTSQGLITDLSGRFAISVRQGDKLSISFIGYAPQELVIGSQTNYRVVMQEDNMALDEVIVIGYGTAKRKDFTGSVSSVKMDDSPMSQMVNINALESLKGNVPGLNIGATNSAGGEPSMLIRGQNSISGSNDPLVVLDGIVYLGSIRDINPNDIATVDVLKDATSVSVYGSRAANGVIAITTKKGASEKPVVSFSMNGGVQEWFTQPDIMNPEQWESTVTARNKYEEGNVSWMSRGELMNKENGKTTDWLKAVTRTGTIQDYQASVSGAAKAANYYVSAAYSDNKGVIKGDDFTRISVMGKVKSSITSWLDMNVDASYSQVDYSGFSASLGEAYKMSPYGVMYRDEENKLLEKYPYAQSAVNPLWGMNDGTRDNKDMRDNFRLNSSVVVKAPWIKGLSYRMNVMLNWEKNSQKNFSYETNYVKEGEYDDESRYSQSVYQTLMVNANGSIKDRKIASWVLDNIINYNTTIFEKHTIDITLVATRDSRSDELVTSSGSDFTLNGNTSLGYNGLHKATTQSVDLDNDLRRNVGYLGRLNYSYDNKYFATASYRRDGSSVFGANNKWANFAAFGLAWNVTNESFMKNFKPLNFLKVKASWGQNGNQGIGPYSTLSTVKNGQSGGSRYEFGDAPGKIYYGLYQGSIGNSLLGWESTEAINIGFESSWLNNRIGLDVDYYTSRTTDQLFDRTIPIMIGFGSIKTSMGRVDNKGIEITVKSHNIKSARFNWHSNVSFWLNRNKLAKLYGEDLDGDGREDDDIASSLFIGKSLGVIYGYKQIGIVQQDDKEYIEATGASPGYPKYADMDGKPGITADDRTILGYNKPNFSMSMANTFSYGNLELYVLLSAMVGGNDYFLKSNPSAYYCNTGRFRDNGINIPYWTPENRSNEYPLASFSGDGGKFQGLQSRGFLRVQDVTLSYRFKQPWVAKSGIKTLKVYFSAKNLGTCTNWVGGDPETGAVALTNVQPVPTTFSIGANISF